MLEFWQKYKEKHYQDLVRRYNNAVSESKQKISTKKGKSKVDINVLTRHKSTEILRYHVLNNEPNVEVIALALHYTIAIVKEALGECQKKDFSLVRSMDDEDYFFLIDNETKTEKKLLISEDKKSMVASFRFSVREKTFLKHLGFSLSL